MEIYWEAFFELTTCRYAPGGPIPHTEIIRYCDQFGIPEEDREIFLLYIRAMDNEMLTIWKEKSKDKK